MLLVSFYWVAFWLIENSDSESSKTDQGSIGQLGLFVFSRKFLFQGQVLTFEK